MSQPPRYRCLKCGKITTGWGASTRCPMPLCGGELRNLREHLVTIREYGQTYIARADGKTATCTAGPQMAAEALAKKLFGGRPFSVKAVTQNTYIAKEDGQ